MASSGALVPDVAGFAQHGRVVKWIAERTEPTAEHASIAIDNLFADYEVWCLSNSLEALPLSEFGAEFDRVREVPQLVDKIRKFGNRYYGIRLVNSNVARLPARRSRS
jgi:hypothetical protein